MKLWPNADLLVDKLYKPSGRLIPNYPLASSSWFRVGGAAEVMFFPEDEHDLAIFLEKLPNDINYCVLGNKSNVLIRDYGISGIVISLGKAFSKIEVVDGDKILSGCSVLDKKLSSFALQNNIGGFSFYNSIPGSVGGAIKMNAGAFGQETKDLLIEVTLIDRSGITYNVKNSLLDFKYRSSNIANETLCLSALYQGYHSQYHRIYDEMISIKNLRNNSQPLREKTGGSTFKNTKHKKAWELIELSGCRGLSVGGASVSRKHCNFIINNGNATARDVESLGKLIISKVKSVTGIKLEWEIKCIGSGPEI
ncbi:MAG: UDP-N-acetylmuramate dehydrogenase [Alphaproteobacteria bacterium]|jgi:UDP-N-acetylmuramate dehydrogenase|tara:strand:- start:33151 stop:34077 length:927 start_codon:yes stop_codon:yes gene_type:complete